MSVYCEVSRPVSLFFDFMGSVLEKYYTNDGIKTSKYRLYLQYKGIPRVDTIDLIDFSIPIYKDAYNTNNNIHSHNVSSLMCFCAFHSMSDAEPRIICQMNIGKPISCNIDELHKGFNGCGYTANKAYIFQFIRYKYINFLAIRFSSEIIKKMHINNAGDEMGMLANSNDCENEILS